MRTLTGLCFLTAILLAGSAHAQSIFIDRGDPSTMSATLGGEIGNTVGPSGSVQISYTYRGVFDLGAEVGAIGFTSGRNKNLRAFDFAPFLNWHVLRSDEDDLPVSVSLLLAVEKVLYTNNGDHASPNGWGVVAGGTIYRRMEIGTSMLFIPEALVAYDFMYTRYYSNALDQKAPVVGDPGNGLGYSTSLKHSARALLRLNLGFKAGHIYTVTPYGGYAGPFGTVGGLLAGAVF